MTHAIVLAAYASLTAIMTWPLVAHFDSAVLGPPGDNLEYVWKMWWFRHALLDLGVSPLFNPDVFYPFGYPVALSETTMAHTILGLPLTALWGEVIAYNCMVYASFVLSGYALHLLLRELGCCTLASFIGGLAFAFCPYRLSHLGAGHLPLMGTAWIPLLFLSLERLVRRPSWRRGILPGLFYAMMALSSWYYAVMVGLFAALYLLLRARPWRALLASRELRGGLLVSVILSTALLAPAAAPILRLYGQGETGYSHSLAYVDQWSASPLDFVYPNAMHPWWGASLTARYYQNINEGLLYLGIVALFLAGVGLWARRGERLPRIYAALGGIAFVLALGTTLHLGGKPVYLRVPSAVEDQFSRAMYVLTGRLALQKVDYSSLRREGALVLPMPTLLLYLFVPFFGAMRVWARFGVLVMLSVAVLAGWGTDWLLRRKLTNSAWRGAVAGALALLLVLDYAVLPYPYGYTEVRGQPVDEWLARQSGKKPIIQYPLDKTWYGWMLYPSRVHGHPIAYGYGTFVPKAYREASEALGNWPSKETLDLLRTWGIDYVLVGARSYADEWPALRQAMEATPALEKVAVFAGVPLFHGDRLLKMVPPSSAVPATELVSGSRQAYLDDEVHVYALK